MLFLLRSDILTLLVNTLTANYEYCPNNTDNLPVPIQMQLSGQLKTFPAFFVAFFDSALNFEHFIKQISLRAQVFLRVIDSQDVFT